MSEVQLQLTTVPYRGTAPVMNDLIGKQIDISCDQATNTTGPISGKQVKAMRSRPRRGSNRSPICRPPMRPG